MSSSENTKIVNSTVTLNELKSYCKEHNIKGYSNKNKSDLIQLILNYAKTNNASENAHSKHSMNNKKDENNNDSDNNKDQIESKSEFAYQSLESSQLKFIDLFCGIGGFHQALKSLDAECVLACDIDKKCRETYKLNYNMDPISNVKDIDEKNMPYFDIICAGFPCQPFSNGGKKKSFEDNRGLLFDEIIRIAKYNKPKFMFLENVKHILKVSNGEVFKYIQEKIKSIGYQLQIFNMSPHNYGIPQQRERIFFVCVRNDIFTNNNASSIELYSKNLNLKCCDIIEEKCDSKYNINEEIKSVLDAWDELIQQFKVGEIISPTILIHDAYRVYTDDEFSKLPLWKRDYMKKNRPLLEKYKHIINEWYFKYKDILSKREIYGKLEWQTGPIKENDSIYNHFIQLRQSGIRVKKNKYFPTLVAISQIPIYGKYKRYITPRECARLQSFPEDFILDKSDKVVYKQMGNSVNVYNTFTVINSTLKHYGLQFIV
jgi:DNA (cytosine-5)-methyltransferase 1